MRNPGSDRMEKITGIGNTILFIVVLVGMFALMATHQYQFSMSLAAAGIYAELWNFRVSHKQYDILAVQKVERNL